MAFIFYLVPHWDESDGGLLDLYVRNRKYVTDLVYNCILIAICVIEENGEPSHVARSLVPQWNSFVLFEVTPQSFHSVSEVLTDCKSRLSINGWFHGEPIQRPQPYIEPPFPLKAAQDFDEELLRAWINPLYLKDNMQIQIQNEFCESSEISLPDFIKEDKFSELSRALKDSEAIVWQWTEAPNKRKYEFADLNNVPPIVSQAYQLFNSEAMFVIMSNMTGLKLHEFAIVYSSSDDDSEGANHLQYC